MGANSQRWRGYSTRRPRVSERWGRNLPRAAVCWSCWVMLVGLQCPWEIEVHGKGS
jgi:hypothetical protein